MKRLFIILMVLQIQSLYGQTNSNAPNPNFQSTVTELSKNSSDLHQMEGGRENVSLQVADEFLEKANTATTQTEQNVYGIATGVAQIGSILEDAARRKQEQQAAERLREEAEAKRRLAEQKEKDRQARIVYGRSEVLNKLHNKWPTTLSTDLSNTAYIYLLSWDDENYNEFRLKISNVINVNRLSDGSWPLIDNVLNQYRHANKDRHFKMVGYFTSKEAAFADAKMLIQAISPYEMKNKLMQMELTSYKTPVNNLSNTNNDSDFWNN